MDPKDLKEIKAIIDLMKKHDLSVFEIEKEGFRLKLEKGPSAQASAAPPPAAPGPPEAVPAAAETSGVIAEVLADNSKPVQFGQALFRVR